MPSFTTISRATVMLAVGAIAFKGWQHVWPTCRASEISCRARPSRWRRRRGRTFRRRIRPRTQRQSRVEVRRHLLRRCSRPRPMLRLHLRALSSQTLTPGPPAVAIPSTSAPATQAPITPLTETAPATGTNDDRVKTLLSRLEQLGGSRSEGGPWGSGGHLFRCCCQAPLGNSPAVTQHFESVAAEPALAVEQVLAKVEAWRTAQRIGGVLRVLVIRSKINEWVACFHAVAGKHVLVEACLRPGGEGMAPMIRPARLS